MDTLNIIHIICIIINVVFVSLYICSSQIFLEYSIDKEDSERHIVFSILGKCRCKWFTCGSYEKVK